MKSRKIWVRDVSCEIVVERREFHFETAREAFELLDEIGGLFEVVEASKEVFIRQFVRLLFEECVYTDRYWFECSKALHERLLMLV